MSPRPLEDEMAEYYANVETYSPEAQVKHQEPLVPCYDALLGKVARHRSPGTLLDVGCGVGVFLKRAAEAGWDVAGTEGSPLLADFASQYTGRRVYSCTDLREAEIEPGTLDVITFLHVLEHVSDPVDTLRTAVSLLRPGGLVVGQVPNQYLDAWARLPVVRGHVSRMSEKTKTNLHHLAFFTPSTFKHLFEEAGLIVEYESTYALSNRRHMASSRFPLLSWPKRGLYSLSGPLGFGPVIELYGRAPA
ncbi:MAG: class I SAM-dependent methyltransferase [Gemmatimonadota bacterium]